MQLEGRDIKVVYLSISLQPVKTAVRVNVNNVIADGISQVLGAYEIEFEQMFMTGDDPALMAAIREKLVLIPEPNISV